MNHGVLKNTKATLCCFLDFASKPEKTGLLQDQIAVAVKHTLIRTAAKKIMRQVCFDERTKVLQSYVRPLGRLARLLKSMLQVNEIQI